MKFEDSSLTTYLVKNLQPLTEADPVILAEYVAALLKKDKPIKELEKLCAEKLLEFLGQGTQSFITKLFQALEDSSFVAPARSSDAIQQLEPSASRIREDPLEIGLKRSAMNTEEFSPSGCPTDQEEKEVTDDDDDDRNHKHRRRDNRSHSSDKDVQGQQLRRPSRKRNRPFENGHTFLANDPQPSENRKEYNPSFLEQRKRPGLGPSLRPYDMGLRTRTNQAFRGDPGSHFDMSTLGRIPTGRGRGRGSIPWSQSDSTFSSVDTYDFSSQMAPQGPTLFAGRGMQSLGLIPGMPSGGLDALHPLGLQASMNQPFNIAIPRQRCRDFEERGFCLRGDMCPMEHGVNRIVVEDVQSLSQFNLPVSLSSAHLLGTPAGSGTLSSTSGPSSLMTNNKILHAKSSKPGATNDGLGLNRELSTSAASGEADLYDPDQPLWNNDHPETSSALMGLSSPQVDDAEPLWNADPSGHHSFRLSDGVESEHPGRSIASTVGSQSITSSVWERIGNPRNRLDMTAKIDSDATSMGNNENETKEQDESLLTIPGTTHQRKQIVSEDGGDKVVSSAAVPRLRIHPACNSGRTSQKALRTLFVNCIPQKNNKKEALFSHFRRFGKVIDIYIPQNSERAFVQFSKSEEAEAALKAPDAVMGNRFIKLWWANRDSIPDNSIRTGDTSTAAPSVSTSVPAQASTGSGGKENLSAILLKVTAAPSSEIPVLTAQPRPVVMNGPKVTPPSQKKLENLELLKEELRLKQELLDQKRNDFRRQLDKLEKQAITVKGEVIAAHTVKRQIPGMPKPMNPVTAGHRPGAEKTLDKTHSGENIESPNSKTNSTVVLQPPMSLKHQTRSSVQLGVPFVANRFKLDNRPSTFRILPLPADLANVGVLREHFSAFGDLSVVELEDSEANAGTKSSEPQKSASARVTFTTRGSAEKAFLNGKNWQGHSLKFTWLTGSNTSSSDHSGRESFPTPSLRSPPDAEVLAETATFGSSSDVKSTCINNEAAASTGNTEPKNPEARMVDVEHMDVPITCQSSETNSLSCETSTTKTKALLVEDGPHVQIKH